MSGSFSSRHLRALNGDIQRDVSKQNQASRNWVLKNMLPSELILHCEKEGTGRPRFLTRIKPYGVLSFPPHAFADRDQLYVFIERNGKTNLFMNPYMFREIWKTVRLGAVTYSSGAGNGEVQASNWDMKGVWLHNDLRIPLDVYYKGNLAAQIGGYDGLTYHGGGASSVYFDNDREGINIGDELVFRYSVKNGKTMFSVMIDDEQATSIHIGKISGGMWGPDPDNALYKTTEPSYTGITYYKNTAAYQTTPTNPNAPF